MKIIIELKFPSSFHKQEKKNKKNRQLLVLNPLPTHFSFVCSSSQTILPKELFYPPPPQFSLMNECLDFPFKLFCLSNVLFSIIKEMHDPLDSLSLSLLPMFVSFTCMINLSTKYKIGFTVYLTGSKCFCKPSSTCMYSLM